MIAYQQLIILLIILLQLIKSIKVSVFGSTGGVGQLICKNALNKGWTVTAVTRNIDNAKQYGNLDGCNFIEADARIIDDRLKSAIESDFLVISLGTTAFPTSKWEGDKNTPKIACVDTVDNILTCIEATKKRPSKIVLLSSIGVERANEIPFSILNSFGVLSAKLESENLLIDKSKDLEYQAIVVRPGRLVGAPFTNFDLAKLLNKDQGDSKGIVMDTRDVLNGDVERNDVAIAITKILGAKLTTDIFPITFSIINADGDAPDDFEWGKLMSLFTVSNIDYLTTRYSS